MMALIAVSMFFVAKARALHLTDGYWPKYRHGLVCTPERWGWRGGISPVLCVERQHFPPPPPPPTEPL